MNRKKPTTVETGGRWVRVGVLSFTVVAPIIRTLIEFMRQPKQSPEKQAEEIQNNISIAEAMALNQLDDLALARRQKAAVQARTWRKQAKQLRSQAKDLRKSLRIEHKQRRKLNKMVKRLQKAGVDWSQELRQRSEGLAEEFMVQGGKITSDLLERSSNATHDLTKRSSKATNKLVKRGRKLSQNVAERSSDVVDDLTERGSKVTHDLLKRGSEMTQDLSERSQLLLQPSRKRKSTNSAFWTILSFSLGLVAAAVATYLLVRRRMTQQDDAEQSEQIELPPDRNMMAPAGTTRPTGEIHHIDSDGTTVATLQAVDVAAYKVESPVDSKFVGVMSTKLYYPVAESPDAKDLVYFVSEEDAIAQGFKVAD